MKYRAILRIRKRLKFVFELITNEKIKTNILQAIPFWIASLLTGLIAVGYTKLFNLSEHLLQSALHWHRWSIFLLTPVCCMMAFTVVKLFANNARGSGIPQVMAAIDISSTRFEKGLQSLLSIRIIIVKIVSSLFMVLGGAAIGREGPTIQIAASVFRHVNKWIPSSWPRLSQSSFILTGAAAGLAAAFNTPLGGIVFAIEELARIHLSFFRSALFTAVIIAGLTAQGFLGPYLYLGYPNVQGLKPIIFAGVVATAIAAGLLGSIMCKIIIRIMRWRQSFSIVQSYGFILLLSSTIALIAFFLNSNILGSGKDLMNTVLFTDSKHLSWHTMSVRILGPILSFNVGASGGIFAPALAAGATVGSYLSGLFGIIGANANILILSGMVGFLTGVTRTPFTSAILVLEMTDRHSVIFHLMLAALVSNIAALIIDKHSFYEQLKSTYVDDAKALSNAAA
jgi:H+/Cl- antiporter ClcA